MKFPKGKKRFVKKPYLKKSKPSKNLRKVVNSIVQKNIEPKSAYYSYSGNFNSGISVVGDMVQVLPYIYKGTADNQRIGDKVSPTRFNIKGWLQSSQTIQSLGNCRIGVRLMILSVKTAPNLTFLLNSYSLALNALLRKGGTTVAFTGALSDLMADINADLITTHYDKVFYLSKPAILSSVGTEDVYRTTKFFDINIPVKSKDLKYDDSIDSGLSPTNWFPFVCCGYVKLDGSSADTVVTDIFLNYNSTIVYKDA